MVTLRVELAARDHPGRRGRARADGKLVGRVRRLIVAGRRDGASRPARRRPPSRAAVMSAIESVVIALAGRPGDDEESARRVALGLLSACSFGLASAITAGTPRTRRAPAADDA